MTRHTHTRLGRFGVVGGTAAMAVLAGCLSLTLAGCGQQQGGSAAGSSAADAGTTSLSTVRRADEADKSLLDGDVALDVNGTLVYEQDVTDYIQSQRGQNGLDDDGAWASYLADEGKDGSAVRDAALGNYIDTILLDQAIRQRGISVSDSEVQDRLDQLKQYYDGFGTNGWEQVRDSMGYTTDDAYASHLSRQMLLQKLQDSATADVQVSDDDAQAYLDQHASDYAGKRASIIVMPDMASAQQVKALIDDGTLTFQEAALTYSLAYGSAYTQAYAAATSSSAADGTSSSGGGSDVLQLDGTAGSGAVVASDAQDARAAVDAEQTRYVGDGAWESALDSAGDIGWVTEDQMQGGASGSGSDAASSGGVATQALADLSAGEVSDPVQTAMGVQIVACTESYDPDADGTQLSDLPSDLQDKVRSDALEQAKTDAWNDFGRQLYLSASIDAAPMPSGLPYDVKVPSTADQASASSAAGPAASVAAGSSASSGADGEA